MIKLAFSTLGCPEWSFQDILSTAKDVGFDGIEIRGIGKELYAPAIQQFQPAEREKTKEKLRSLQLVFSCLTSACYLFDRQNEAELQKQGREYIDLAGSLSVPYIRVLGDRDPYPAPGGIEDEYVLSMLRELAGYAKEKQVTLLVETNGVYADSRRLLRLIESVQMPSVGVLWDIHHPYRYFGETPQQTYDILWQWIRYVHVKDSVRNSDGSVRYKMMGYGDVPNQAAIRLLLERGYDGFVSLEWVKRWYSDLEAPGVVFLHFINYMKKLLDC